MKKDIVVGIDLGTTKICVLVGEVSDTDTIQVVGMANIPSHGLRKGIIVNVETTVEDIVQAIEKAEEMAQHEMHSVIASIAGGHIKSLNSHGQVPITHQDQEIREDDMVRAINSAKAISIPMDREVIHTIPQEFYIDGVAGIKNPIGMNGVRLEVDVHIVTGAVNSAQNIIKSINRAGLDVDDMVLQPLAASMAALEPEEKESGVILIDIGGGTTDYIVYVDNTVMYSGVLALGGDHITNDISLGLKISRDRAETLKKRFGTCIASSVRADEECIMPGSVGKQGMHVSRKVLSQIIQCRIEEIMMLVKSEIQKAGLYDRIGSGIVLTGGTALTRDFVDFTSNLFSLPCRVGRPRRVSGLVEVLDSPAYATAVGLLVFGMQHNSYGSTLRFQRNNGFMSRMVSSVRSWIGV